MAAEQPATSANPPTPPRGAGATTPPARRRRPAPPVTPSVAARSGPGTAGGTSPGELSGPPELDVYARLSYALNGETVQVDDQVEMCMEKIEARGGRVGEIFRDNSLSAWNPRVVRPEWNTLMARLESGASDGVMVYDLTRFSRKIMEGERLVDLASRGVRVWSLSGEYDLTTADGRRHFREAMVAAAGESDKISERVQRGKLRRARKGRHHGGPRPYGQPGLAPAPSGWEPGDPREAVAEERVAAERVVVRECYDRLLAGESVSALVRELNARGTGGERAALPTSGGLWHRGPLTRALARPAHAGLLAHRGEIMGELVGADPIVSREEWERLCAVIAARKIGRPPSVRHLLSGLLTCAVCGTQLTGWPRGALPPYPDGEPKREYRCRRRNDPDNAAAGIVACGRNHIDGRAADQAVAVAMMARLGDPRRAERVAAHLAAVREQRGTIEAEIARWEATADDLVTKTATWGVARVEKGMAPMLREIDKLRADLARLDEPDTAHAATADAVAAWTEALDRADVAAQRAMIRRAFPNLTLAMPSRYGDHSPDRIAWDG